MNFNGTDVVRARSGKLEAVYAIAYRILESPHRVNDTRLPLAHREHLADAARFEEARHDKQRAVCIEHLPDRFRISAQVEKILILAVDSHQFIFILGSPRAEEKVSAVVLRQDGKERVDRPHAPGALLHQQSHLLVDHPGDARQEYRRFLVPDRMDSRNQLTAGRISLTLLPSGGFRFQERTELSQWHSEALCSLRILTTV